MAKLLGVLVVALAGWGVWSYVLRPALQPPVVDIPTAVHVVTPASTRPAPSSGDATGAMARAHSFLAAWAAGRYGAMYRDLSVAAQQGISETAFTKRYTGIAAVSTITGVRPAILAANARGDSAAVTYTVSMDTTAVGPISYTTTMPLHDDGGHWGVGWTPNLIFPGLGGYRVHLYPEPSRRGGIVDRLGRPLAFESEMLQVGVVRQNMRDQKGLVRFLAGWLHRPEGDILAKINVSWAVAHPEDLVPIDTVTDAQWNTVPPQVRIEQQNNGLYVNQNPGDAVARRIYPRGMLAAPLLGYVRSTDGHGSAGLEAWADGYLSGRDGAKLAIATPPDFQYIDAVVKRQPKQDGATVHLTLDATLQAAAEQALTGTVGAVVALRPSAGAVLAMVSTPAFDPNGFAAGLDPSAYAALANDPRAPLLNRAAAGQYPLGSVFKVVTAGAALEKDGYTIDATVPGPAVWYGLGPGNPKHDWLAAGHGIVSLHEALVQSCDTCFYQIGQQLDNKNHYLLPDYARSWGFGATTGISGVVEAPGVVPDPHYTQTQLKRPWYPGDPVDLAIGQDNLLVTPLQAAQMLAALGNGGVMYRPRVVDRVTASTGATVRDFPPTVARTLPLSAGRLQDILKAMRGVTTEPTGTATNVFTGFPWSVAGKTGTAQTGDGRQPDAWFAALAPADHPRIALIVMVEHAAGSGEGSVIAAPKARQILQTFFTRDKDLAGTGPVTTTATGASNPNVINVP